MIYSYYMIKSGGLIHIIKGNYQNVMPENKYLLENKNCYLHHQYEVSYSSAKRGNILVLDIFYQILLQECSDLQELPFAETFF